MGTNFYDRIAICGLSADSDNKCLRYDNAEIQLRFGLYKDVSVTNWLATWKKVKTKVSIYSINDVTIYSDDNWVSLERKSIEITTDKDTFKALGDSEENSYVCDTGAGWGNYSIISRKITLSNFKYIKKIKIECQDADDSSRTASLVCSLDDSTPLKDISYWAKGTNGGFTFPSEEYSYSGVIHNSANCEFVSQNHTILGCYAEQNNKEILVLNSKYFSTQLAISVPTLLYYGKEQLSEKVILKYEVQESNANSTTTYSIESTTIRTYGYYRYFWIDLSTSTWLNQLEELKSVECSFQIGDAVSTVPLTLSLKRLPTSGNLKEQLKEDFLNYISGTAYNVQSVEDQSLEKGAYIVTLNSFLSGEILFTEHNPLLWIDDSEEATLIKITTTTINGKVTQSETKICDLKLKEGKNGFILPETSLGDFKYEFSSSSETADDSEAAVNSETVPKQGELLDKESTYYIRTKLKDSLSDSEVLMDFQILEEGEGGGFHKYNFTSSPIILNASLSYTYKIKSKDEDVVINFLNPDNILNPDETVEININKDFIFCPQYQLPASKLSDEKLKYWIHYKETEYSQEESGFKDIAGTDSNTSGESSNLSYSIPNSDSEYYTKWLQLGLRVLLVEGQTQPESFSSKYSLIQLGRFKGASISQGQVTQNNFSYRLNDYGGDKTETLGQSYFLSSINSLKRSESIKSEIIFSFLNKDKEPVSQQAFDLKTEYLIENKLITLPLELPSISEETETGETETGETETGETETGETETGETEKDSTIKYFRITYVHTYSNVSKEEIKKAVQSDDFEVSNITTRPTLSIREHGIIINGKPEQELETFELKDSEESEATKPRTRFLEINAINDADEIVFKFPSGSFFRIKHRLAGQQEEENENTYAANDAPTLYLEFVDNVTVPPQIAQLRFCNGFVDW